MAKFYKAIILAVTFIIALSSISFIGCAPVEKAKLYFDYGETEVVENKEYKTIIVGQPVGELPKETPSGEEIDFWVYNGKIITEETLWWYRAEVTAKAVCLDENEYLYLFDLDGGVADANFKLDLVHSVLEDELSIQNPTKEMHYFLGWVAEEGGEPTRDLVLNSSTAGNTCYRAVWQRNYSISISLRSKCEEDSKVDYVYYNWRTNYKDPATDLPLWFELKVGEKLSLLSIDPYPQDISFKFKSWVWQKDNSVVIDENTVFNEETFGNVKDIVIIIKTKHNYPDFDY